jgi:RES domain-containing protein
MRVFRIERRKYLEAVLSGEGAARSSGNRWNSLYTAMVYTAQTRALALLELAVHLDLTEDLPTDRYFVEIEIPDQLQISEIKVEDLPSGWNENPPNTQTRRIGDKFVADGHAVVLRVPSSIIPMEYNYLINPRHPDSAGIRVISSEELHFDPRLRQFRSSV